MDWYWADDTYRAWDKWRRENEALVRHTMDSWIDKNPDSVAVAVAVSVNEGGVQLGNIVIDSFADLLRLGQGFGQGGWGGFAQDGLRLFAIYGPVTKGVATVARSKMVQRVVNPLGENCTWVAATQALRMSGVRHFAKVEDLVKAAGLESIAQTGPAFIKDFGPLLQKLGARVKYVEKIGADNLPSWKSLDDVTAYLKSNPNGTMVFAVSPVTGAPHSMIAFLHPTRGLQIADRSGRIVKNLSELEDLYPGISEFDGGWQIAHEMLYVENSAIAKDIACSGLTSLLVLEVKAMFIKPPEEAEPVPIGNRQGTYDKKHRAFH